MEQRLGIAIGLIDALENQRPRRLQRKAARIAYHRPIRPIADILRGRKLPFIFITGYGARGLPEHYRDTPTLQKPFQMQDLKATLARVLPA